MLGSLSPLLLPLLPLPHPGISRYWAPICPAAGLLGTLPHAALFCGAACMRVMQHATAKTERSILAGTEKLYANKYIYVQLERSLCSKADNFSFRYVGPNDLQTNTYMTPQLRRPLRIRSTSGSQAQPSGHGDHSTSTRVTTATAYRGIGRLTDGILKLLTVLRCYKYSKLSQ